MEALPDFKGMFNSSFQGHSVDVLKSWLQKAIRRGLVEEALYAGLRLLAFYNQGGFSDSTDQKWAGRAIYSNLLNRLIVTAGEDLGVGALGALTLIDARVEELRREDLPWEERKEKLAQLILFMCRQPKSRLVGLSKAFALSSPLFSEERAQIDQLTDLTERVLYVLQEKDNQPELYAFLACGYAYQLFLSPLKEKIARGYPKKRLINSPLVYKLWNIYLESSQSELIELLYKWFLQEKEKHIYLLLATLCFLRAHSFNFSYTPLEEGVDLSALVEQALKETRSPPEWAVDMHTKEGRAQGKDSLLFAEEGAHIEQAWPYCPAQLKEFYLESKREASQRDILPSAPEIPLPPLEASFSLSQEDLLNITLPRGQLLTSRNKRPVYLDEDYAYKGPWSNPEKLQRLILRREQFLLLDSQVLLFDLGQDFQGGWWMRSPQLACRPREEWQIEMKKGTLESQPLPIIIKESMGLWELDKLPEESIAQILFGPDFLFRSYVDAALLGVGDMGLRNHLVAIQPDGSYQSWIIDWDDNSHRQALTSWASLFSKSTEKLERIVALGREKYQRGEDLANYVEQLQSRTDLVYCPAHLEMLVGLLGRK